MIFLDSNMFLRYLGQDSDERSRQMAKIALSLFESVERGEEEITTSEVVLHEVAFVLASKRHFGVPVPEIADALSYILRLPGFRLQPGLKRRYLSALELWTKHPALGLADAIVATTAIELEVPLATFDAHFDRVPGVVRWPRSS